MLGAQGSTVALDTCAPPSWNRGSPRCHTGENEQAIDEPQVSLHRICRGPRLGRLCGASESRSINAGASWVVFWAGGISAAGLAGDSETSVAEAEPMPSN